MRTSRPGAAFGWIVLAGWAMAAGASAQPRGGSAADLARSAMAGDDRASASLEALLEPFFARKDLWSLDASGAAREIAKLLGSAAGADSVRWFDLETEGPAMRLVAIDVSTMSGVANGKGYVAYGILEKSLEGGPRISWYHDVGRKIEEQGGVPWSPRRATLLPAEAGKGGRSLVVEAAPRASRVSTGLLILVEKASASAAEADWVAARRIAGPAGGRVIGYGPEGAVFLADREAPKGGALTGVPPGTYRALVFYPRQNGFFSAEPTLASISDVVTATEDVLAALRRGDREGARRLCASPDVLESMLYFSPEWKGGGRIVRAEGTKLEIVYEERERPTLRLEFTYVNRGGALLLSSVTGRAEGAQGKTGRLWPLRNRDSRYVA